jgi:hypothetical protein
MNFPNLDELLFLKVLAFPNASRRGFESKTYFSIPSFLELAYRYISIKSTFYSS